jgi:F0F1-type ATP synthase assembly protein I
MEENDKNKNGSKIGGVIFVGCMFVGAGIGMLYDKVPVGGAIGMGIGFIAMGAIMAYYRKNN